MKYLLKFLDLGSDEVSFPLQKLNSEEQKKADGLMRQTEILR